LEIEARSPGAAAWAFKNSERMAEAVKRYLVTEHAIPVLPPALGWPGQCPRHRSGRRLAQTRQRRHPPDGKTVLAAK